MKLKILLTVVAVAAATFAVVQTSRISGLRERVAAAEQKRLNFVMEMLCPGKGETIEVVGVNPESAYRKAADAYQARDMIALRTALPLCNNCPVEIEKILLSPFNRSFLRTDTLQEFTRVEDFECFAWVNIEVAMFFGRSCFREKSFEIPISIEYLTFLRFRKYKEKFHAEGKKDLEQVARRFMDLWIAHIESPEGFTRIGARGMIRQQTELVDAARPGCGMSQKGAISLGRGMTMGLVRCGYTPKWLDKDFPPLPEEKESKGAEASNNAGH